jgi:hypothetical protein
VTFAQDGKALPLNKRGIVSIPFQALEDGRTFRLGSDFFAAVPEGLVGKGEQLGHDAGQGQVVLIKGPAVETGPGTFRLRWDRTLMLEKPSDVWLMAVHPGGARHRRSVQAGLLSVPGTLTAGKRQSITFPAIADIPLSTPLVELKAASDSGLPVEYYVLSGPAEISGGTLRLTALPPRTRYPVNVTVVALQCGRTIEPLYQSAQPIERTFQIVAKPGGAQ